MLTNAMKLKKQDDKSENCALLSAFGFCACACTGYTLNI